VAVRIEYHLNNHDVEYRGVSHQAVVLVQDGSNAAKMFCDIYSKYYPGRCAAYDQENIIDDFKSGKVRVLAATPNLLDEVVNSRVTVLGIVFKIPPTSRIRFDQYVSKVVHRSSPDDRVAIQVVSHDRFCQMRNYENFEKLAEFDCAEE